MGAPAALPPERLEALDLDCVADRGAGGMALDQVNVARGPAGFFIRQPHRTKLAFAAGGEQVAATVIREPNSRDERVDLVAVLESVVQALEHEHPRPFAGDQAVGALVERTRPAPCRERAKLREAHLNVERIGARHSSAEHGVGPAGLELAGGESDGIKRRGTGRVDRVGRPGKIECARPERRAARRERRSKARRPVADLRAALIAQGARSPAPHATSPPRFPQEGQCSRRSRRHARRSIRSVFASPWQAACPT